MIAMAALTLVWGLLDASLGLSLGVAHLAPFLLMLVPLLSGRYVGERRLARLVGVLSQPRCHPRSSSLPPRARVVWMPRGSGLLGRSLAVRPPPAALAQL